MIRLSPEIHNALGAEPFKTLMHLHGEVYRRQGDRETVRIFLDNQFYFIKRYHRNFITCGAKSEWEALRICEALGVKAPALKGFGSKGSQSFVLMEALTNAKSLEIGIPAWPDKRLVIEQMADIARTLHQKGYYHRDFYICHFFWNHEDKKVTLIDLHRLFKPVFFKKHFLEKDLSALLFSVLDLNIRQKDVFRFLKYYFRLPLRVLLKQHDILLKNCIKKAIALYQKAYHQKPRHIAWLSSSSSWPDRVGPSHHLFEIDGHVFESDTCLRVLDHRRIVLSGMWNGKRVVVKFFTKQREYERERQGLDALAPLQKNIPLFVGAHHRMFSCIYPYLSGQAPTELTIGLLQTIATLHNHGLIHTDPHLDNFRTHQDNIYVLDPASIQHASSQDKMWINLAQLYAQWPAYQDEVHLSLLPEYIAARGISWNDNLRTLFVKKLIRAREYRLKKWMSKICRNATEFYEKSRYYVRIYAKRSFANVYAQTLMRFPESYFQEKSIYLKQGRSNTVVRATIGTESVVIKRYNIKSWLHAVKNVVRGSKARRAWKNTHLCLWLGVRTPKPLAMIEERFFYIPWRSYLVTHYVDGISLDKIDMSSLSAEEVERIKQAVERVFKIFKAAQCYHGDLKLSNWIWDGKEMQLIDLDSLQYIKDKEKFLIYHAKDVERYHSAVITVPKAVLPKSSI